MKEKVKPDTEPVYIGVCILLIAAIAKLVGAGTLSVVYLGIGMYCFGYYVGTNVARSERGSQE